MKSIGASERASGTSPSPSSRLIRFLLTSWSPSHFPPSPPLPIQSITPSHVNIRESIPTATAPAWRKARSAFRKYNMANEEQRKAFAAYMGGGSSSTASAAQSVPQYPGSVANPAGQYLLNVYVSCKGTSYFHITDKMCRRLLRLCIRFNTSQLLICAS